MVDKRDDIQQRSLLRFENAVLIRANCRLIVLSLAFTALKNRFYLKTSVVLRQLEYGGQW